jgi:hypothetical protein
MWFVDLVGICLYLATTKIYACSNWIFIDVRCVCVRPCGCYQGLPRWYV